jgi:small subunit ribosomal protein S3
LGHKTHPIGNRIGIIRTWDSRWYQEKGYAGQLHEDLSIRNYIKGRLYHAGVSKIEIERVGEKEGQKIRLIIHTARPGIIIGKKGAEVERLKKDLEAMVGKQITIDIKEVRKPELDAQLVAENICMQLEKRVAYRRAMKKAVASAMRFGAQGIRVQSSGRLAGAEIARREWYREGRVPLHTFRADIDYGFAEARTTYGVIGVKVWIYKGDVLSAGKE